ncbi:hypothetical protein PFISCL1PPCAC_10406 [Pristionchus fissidentatus]|uniref:non-specific serine/threonine protein kinase n=1 Tax=Pristionchus fissidentatus TaxID=1538716 RepID=A0AAV5VL57_9BILA|nr:hypothetical protein PFISCL1PPCAC_10406 [Pristionchus fissidentatus]
MEGKQKEDVLLPRISLNAKSGKSLIPIGGEFRNYSIKGIIGRGGYGEIYYAFDPRQSDHVALKVEGKMRRGKLAKRTILEQKILLRMQGRPHCPKMAASGSVGNLNFIALEVLSINLSDLRKVAPGKRLGNSTVARIVQQAIGALYDLHNIGYVHRDVKPPNMCFGIRPETRHVLYLLDFGLVRKFMKEDGTLRPRREKAGFRGTFRYVSVRVHEKQEQCPADDLTSLVYSAIELSHSFLPWKQVTNSEQMRQYKKSVAKQGFSCVSESMGLHMVNVARAVVNLVPWTTIDYVRLQSMLNGATDGLKVTDPYEWDVGMKK